MFESQFGGLFVFVQTCKDDHVLSDPYDARSSIPTLFVRLLWRIPVHIWDQNDEILHQLSVCNLHWSFKWNFVHWILYRTERVKNLVLFQEKYVSTNLLKKYCRRLVFDLCCSEIKTGQIFMCYSFVRLIDIAFIVRQGL